MANAKSIYLETTSVSAGKTVAEMMELLQRAPGVVEVVIRASALQMPHFPVSFRRETWKVASTRW